VLSLVLLTGFLGQISLMQWAMAGIGAFAGGAAAARFGDSLPVALVVGAVVAAALGLVVGYPALRIRGLSLTIITLGAAVVIQQLIIPDLWQEGLNLPRPSVFGRTLSPLVYAYTCLALAGLLGAAVWQFRRTSTGKRVVAVRSSERAGTAVGINIAAAKLLVFATSSGIAGLGGVLFAYQARTIGAETFTLLTGINLLATALIMGVGVVSGGLLGGLVAGLVPAVLTQNGWSGSWFASIAGVGLVLASILHPDGVLVRGRRKTRVRNGGETSGGAPPAPRTADGSTPTGNDTRIELRDAVVAFGAVRAVDGVSLSIEGAGITGLIGPNGAGKTTLIDALSGFVRLTSGTLRVGDRDITSLPAWQRVRAGMARTFQGDELFDTLTVRENLEVAGLASGDADAVMLDLGLTDYADVLAGDLPAGDRRIVGLGRALATNPSALLLDEPGAGLLPHEVTSLAALLKRLSGERRLLVLLVDHDMELIRQACSRVVVLDAGRVLADGEPDAVRADQEVLAAYLG